MPRALVLALPLALALAAPAGASCGGVVYAKPRRAADPGHRPPLAIGDSTMLLAVKPLARAGFEANARGCRPVYEGIDILAQRKRRRRLPHVVLMHLGLNAGIQTREIIRALGILGPRRVLVLVTPRGGHDSATIRAAGRRWPRRVRVLDWVRAYQGHREYFSEPHGLHLSQTGVRAFVRLCIKVVRPVTRRRG
ncbi:MAG: hypothetical protein QOE65_2160 [Solirubrobacteraceae bacterium]|nr:hypothetical protein [Solirubrobacteraceae bacterium]